LLAAPRHGFAFLSTTKSGSTALEQAFTPHAQVILRGPPRLKHINASGFHKHVEPLLHDQGFPRDSYEVVAIVREPLDWLLSWWRYRSRDALRRRRGAGGKDVYAGDTSFEEWATAQIDNDMQGIGRMSRFVAVPDGARGVDRLWRYEHLDGAREWMSGRVGEEVSLRVVNASPKRPADVPDALRRRIETYFEPEYRLYENAS
jgi:hypothetical protein